MYTYIHRIYCLKIYLVEIKYRKKLTLVTTYVLYYCTMCAFLFFLFYCWQGAGNKVMNIRFLQFILVGTAGAWSPNYSQLFSFLVQQIFVFCVLHCVVYQMEKTYLPWVDDTVVKKYLCKYTYPLWCLRCLRWLRWL